MNERFRWIDEMLLERRAAKSESRHVTTVAYDQEWTSYGSSRTAADRLRGWCWARMLNWREDYLMHLAGRPKSKWF